MPEQVLLNLGTRSIALQDLPESAWRYLAGHHSSESGDLTPESAFQKVPWLYRGCTLRAQAISDIPWIITKGDTEIANSEETTTVKGYEWLARLSSLLYRTELAVCLWGAAYWFPLRNMLGTRTLEYRWLLPSTVNPVIDKKLGLIAWKRQIGSETLDLDRADIVYWWLPSVTTELGVGTSPAQVALVAAGLIANVDEWAKGFFARGATALTLLSVEGNPDQKELDRLEKWWKRLLGGVKKAYETIAVRASVKPVVIGSPPKDLAMTELTEAKQKDIAVAFGIPFTLLFSEASNRATAVQDDVRFYTHCVLPEAEFLEAGLNEQIFGPLGLEFAFRPEKLEAVQVFQVTKALPLLAFFQADAITKNELRAEMGWEPVDGGDAFQADVAPPAQLAPGALPAAADQTTIDQSAPGAGGIAGATSVDQNKAADLARWEAKALKALARGRSANVPFATDFLDPEEQTLIRLALGVAVSPAEVKAALFGEPKAKKPALPGLDGSDAQRATLERRHAKAIVAALQRQLDAALPPGTNESNVLGAEQRAKDASQPLRDALYAMLADAVLLGTDVGRRQTEALQGVGQRAMVQERTPVGLGGSADWSLVNTAAREWASQYAYDLVGGINATSAKVLQSAVAEYVANTLSLEQLTAHIAADFGAARAATIAATEVTRAYSQGTTSALQAGGIIDAVQWKTAADELVCPICAPLADTITPIGDAMQPPAHVNCRCWVVPSASRG